MDGVTRYLLLSDINCADMTGLITVE